MDSDFGSISNGEFLTPFEDDIYPTIEEDIGETNLGETLSTQIGDKDNINEHGIYWFFLVYVGTKSLFGFSWFMYIYILI